ncbi:MAG TPA: cyanophycinase [Bdellovibrionales bacterium]|nr:cyanophycinase [Bdellovibrionales bacterium]
MVRKHSPKKQKLMRGMHSPKGTLIIIGGHEDRTPDSAILKEVAKKVGRGKLVISTLASQTQASELWRLYKRVFTKLGVKNIVHLSGDSREDCLKPDKIMRVTGAKAVFFTGGDQLSLAAYLGGTVLCERIREIYHKGGLIAGTSAGASVLAEHMIIEGHADESHRVENVMALGPGIGVITDVIIDQHFAERGRIGRLLGAVAENGKYLGIGIDEDTALIIRQGREARAIGSGAVYLLDAQESTHTNVSHRDEGVTLSIFNLKMHVLSKGDTFNIDRRMPSGH